MSQHNELKEQLVRCVNDYLGPPSWVSDDMPSGEVEKREKNFLRNHAEALKVILEVAGQHIAIGRFYEIEYPSEVLLQAIINSADSFENEHLNEGFKDAEF